MEKVAAARSELVLALDAIWSSGRKRPRLMVRDLLAASSFPPPPGLTHSVRARRG